MRGRVVSLRLGLAAVVAVGAAGLGLAHGGAAAGPVDERPNVVVILTDDQDARSLKVMEQTRNLLVKRGVKFSRHYATFPLCCPSRASYLTGQYAHNHGVMDNNLPDGGFLKFDDSATSAVSLAAAGYQTAWIGKYLNGYPPYARSNPDDIPDGITRWYAGLTSRMFNWFVNDDGEIAKLERSAENYQTDVYARESRRFIRGSLATGQPFFLTVSPLAPHGEPKRSDDPNPRPAPRHKGAFEHEPLPKPRAFNEADVDDKPSFVRDQEPLDSQYRQRLRDRYRARLASLLAVDDLVAGVVEELRESGALRNTYIMFTSDNGYLLGEHRLSGKTQLYEESAKVPMIIRGPDLPDGAKHEQPTANVDLMPTILELAEASALAPVDGASLLPVAQNPEADTDRVVLLENRRSSAVEDGRYVYVEHDSVDEGGVDEYELYDLQRDPRQLENLHIVDAAAVRPEVLSQRPELFGIRNALADRLDDLRDCQGAGCR